MVFIETAIFTKAVDSLLTHDEFREMQNEILRNREAGVVIRNSGGLRKLRFGAEGRGKRGGVRVIYFWRSVADETFLLLIYPKNKKDDLSASELALLRNLVKELD